MMMPTNTDLRTWASSLVIDFPNDNIPFYPGDSDWKTWGNFLIQENSFLANQAPGTSHFSDWKDWALAVYRQMANVA
jgi:hypothetical protein